MEKPELFLFLFQEDNSAVELNFFVNTEKRYINQIFHAFQEQIPIVIWLDHWPLSSKFDNIHLANIVNNKIYRY